jgi:hypothetical protein
MGGHVEVEARSLHTMDSVVPGNAVHDVPGVQRPVKVEDRCDHRLWGPIHWPS